MGVDAVVVGVVLDPSLGEDVAEGDIRALFLRRGELDGSDDERGACRSLGR
ncbi:hypothetical protein [Streptomyces sp. CB01580]|uniref:hypothetical protein n=1 Tax=Streptomyces sp. CB01580 TaxID=1703933 RepID=UPI001F5B2D79|nr:hypothetical protein [Streptomyces sp. CB01580]